MTIRNLDTAFHPKSVAVIGASERKGSVGQIVLSNILTAGFPGTVWPINPKYARLGGLKCHARISDLPSVPDLAVIATPALTVPDIIGQLGAHGTRSAIVLSAGITEANGLRQKMLEAARPHLVRIIGPNAIGLMLPVQKLNASFAHLSPLPGNLALLSQSGAIATTLIDWAQARGIGFSHVISLGDMADVDIGDCLDMLARDREVGAVLMYLESVTNARKFMSAARALARFKPIVAVKSGRHARSAAAAKTHTGALTGEDAVFDAALERAGIVRVDTLEELFAAAQALTRLPARAKGRTAIITNGGGAGVMALDALLDHDGQLAQLSAKTLAALDSILPAAWSRSNPVDILGDASPDRYARALALVAADPGVDALLALNCPTGLASTLESAAVVEKLSREGLINGKPLITAWLGDYSAVVARGLLDQAGIASFETPTQAVDALVYLDRRARAYDAMLRVPEIGSEDVPEEGQDLSELFERVRADGRTMLLEDEAKLAVSRFGIAVPRALLATTLDEVGDKAAQLLGQVDAVAVKLVSKAVSHKSDVGGVILGLRTRQQCEAAAKAIADRLAQSHPDLVPEGYSIQEMINMADARELLIGAQRDPIFGPALMFGAGGIGAEVVRDTAMALPPLDDKLAQDLIAKTKISRLLNSYRNVPAANIHALIAALIGVSRLVMHHPEIESLDINPLLVGPDGAIALDARIVLGSSDVSERPAADRLALKPYPSGWNKSIVVRDGAKFDVRPIRPTDAALYPGFFKRISTRDIRMRFNVAMDQMPHDMLVRLTQIDYDREMAFVALQSDDGTLAGVVRLAADPDHKRAEFALLVRTDMQGRGLGWALLEHLIAYARADGIETIVGDVYCENSRMLDMCEQMGFVVTSAHDEPGVAIVSLALEPKPTGA